LFLVSWRAVAPAVWCGRQRDGSLSRGRVNALRKLPAA
jgi:hypothetical protein